MVKRSKKDKKHSVKKSQLALKFDTDRNVRVENHHSTQNAVQVKLTEKSLPSPYN